MELSTIISVSQSHTWLCKDNTFWNKQHRKNIVNNNSKIISENLRQDLPLGIVQWHLQIIWLNLFNDYCLLLISWLQILTRDLS